MTYLIDNKKNKYRLEEFKSDRYYFRHCVSGDLFVITAIELDYDIRVKSLRLLQIITTKRNEVRADAWGMGDVII